MGTRRIEKEGKTVQEATELALLQLNVNADEVDIEIIEEPSKGFLGLGGKLAKVAVTVIDNNGEEEEYEEDDSERDSDENEDIVDEIAVEFLQEVFAKMKLAVQFSVEVFDSEVSINITGEDAGIIIGRRGETLDAIQYLTNLVVNRKCGGYKRVVIDVESYRLKRQEALTLLAERVAAKVVKIGKDVALEPMNPYERRIIHFSLQDNDKVETHSEGEEPNRKVVVTLK